MARPLLPDDLWTEIVPLLPPPRPRSEGRRPPIENRAALTGLLFVLRSGLAWEMWPAEMGCGCSMSCWRRLPIRYERRADIDEAFTSLAASLITIKRIGRFR